MLEKLISLSETEDQILQKISDNLSISEENLIRQVLTDFLARQADELNEQTWLDPVTNNPSTLRLK
jgi:membrane-bound ClpP family serine protease